MARITAHFIIWLLDSPLGAFLGLYVVPMVVLTATAILLTGCAPVLHVTIDPVPGGEVARVRCEGAAVEISSPATLTVREVE